MRGRLPLESRGFLCRRSAGRLQCLSGEGNTTDSERRLTPADLFIVLFVPLAWGLNFIVIKDALAEFSSPLTFNAPRWTLATAILLILVAARRDSLSIAPRDWGAVLRVAFIGNAMQQVTFINGIRLTTAGHSALILGLAPVMVALADGLLRLERVNRRTWAGIVLSVIGLIFLIRPGTMGAPRSALLGDLLTLASAACWAFYSVASRPLALRYPPATVATTTVGLAAGFLVAIAIPAFPAEHWRAIRWTGWAGVLYSGGLVIAFGYALWNTALRRLGSARTAVIANLNPVVAVAAAWILLGERLDGWQALGAALVVTGIALTRR